MILKTFHFIGNKYITEKIIIENDVIILFSLFKNAKSYKYLDELGYYYFFTNNDSITNTRYDCLFKLEQGYNRYKICFNYINKGYGLIKYVISLTN